MLNEDQDYSKLNYVSAQVCLCIIIKPSRTVTIGHRFLSHYNPANVLEGS